MKVIYDIGQIKKSIKNAVLAIGVFDGIHLGHKELIERAVKKAKAINGKAVVLTFFPHPVQVLKPEIYMPYITTLSYRLKLIEELGVAKCVVIRFTKSFANLDPKKFIQKYIVKPFHPKEVFVGEDFRFGKNREGTLDFFIDEGARNGFCVNPVRSIKGGGRKIGSSQIRKLIADGKLFEAKKLLGRDVMVVGKVVKGDARGQQLGFPTANIHPQNEIIPPVGVYAVRVVLGNKKYDAMANVGVRPSFKYKNTRINIEIHIFDFKKDLYGKEIAVEFIKRIRNEKKFDKSDGLISQLKRDEKKAKSFLACQ